MAAWTSLICWSTRSVASARRCTAPSPGSPRSSSPRGSTPKPTRSRGWSGTSPGCRTTTSPTSPGVEQAYTAQGWAKRFDFPFDDAAIGYGQSSADVAAVRVADPALLRRLLRGRPPADAGVRARADRGRSRPRRRRAVGPAGHARRAAGVGRRRRPAARGPGGVRARACWSALAGPMRHPRSRVPGRARRRRQRDRAPGVPRAGRHRLPLPRRPPAVGGARAADPARRRGRARRARPGRGRLRRPRPSVRRDAVAGLQGAPRRQARHARRPARRGGRRAARARRRRRRAAPGWRPTTCSPRSRGRRPPRGASTVVVTSDRDAFGLIDDHHPRAADHQRRRRGVAADHRRAAGARCWGCGPSSTATSRRCAATRRTTCRACAASARRPRARLLTAFGTARAAFDDLAAVAEAVGPGVAARLAAPGARATWELNCQVMAMREDVVVDLTGTAGALPFVPARSAPRSARWSCRGRRPPPCACSRATCRCPSRPHPSSRTGTPAPPRPLPAPAAQAPGRRPARALLSTRPPPRLPGTPRWRGARPAGGQARGG